METLELFQRFSVALAIGMLIGLERGWQEREDTEGRRTMGLRTFAISALLGATWGALSIKLPQSGAIALGLAFVVFSLIVALYRFRETQIEGTLGATTVVAAMSTFTLAAFALIGDVQVAAAAGVAVTGLLALKRHLHGWLRQLNWLELRSALVLAAMSFILLPVLPNAAVPRLGGLNPYEIWLMTVLIAAISFAGYIAVRVVGQKRGLLLTGISAGLVSSTAVTITLARLAYDRPEHKNIATAGAIAAGATMMTRVLVVVGLFNTALMYALLPALGAAAAVTAISAILLMQRHRDTAQADGEISLQNPFELSTVLKFGALLAAIMLAAEFAKSSAGASGLLGLAAVSGIADVDAITLAMSRQAGQDVALSIAAQAIALAVAVNTASKAVIAWLTGGAGPGIPMALVALIAIAAGLAALLFVPTAPTA